jgi:hypothetical protein
MSDDNQGIIHGTSEGGMIAAHGSADALEFYVGPSTADQSNTLSLPLIPVACWRVDDIRFHFGSSFVTPEIKTELQALARLVAAHPGCPLSIFGHADPVGSDDYNKTLSGRRATAIYGMLTRNSSLWEQLYNQPKGDDNWTTVKASQTMQTATGLPAGTPLATLITTYMDTLCGDDLRIEPTDFLAAGADPQGKGDYQGCSEFNPVMLFSLQEERAFAAAQDKTARNNANACNRRVMVLIFRQNSKVDPTKWPCPRATEGVAGCRKRFWSDGETRRSQQLEQDRREFLKSEDTFGCRFYQRLATGSPCESILKNFRIRLYDPDGQYIANAPCEVTVGDSAPYTDEADDEGIITLRWIKPPSPCFLKWGMKPDEGEDPKLQFSLNMLLIDDEAVKAADGSDARKKLNNLGYCDPDQKINVEDFQRDYGDLATPKIYPTGELDDETLELLDSVYQQCADNLRQTEPSDD